MTQSVTWTEPLLCSYDGDLSQPWFVYFDISDEITDTTLRKQFRGGINYWHTKEDRLREGNALRKMWKKKLEAGQYDPFKRSHTGTIHPPTSIKSAIEKVLELKKTSLKRKSIRNYTDISNMFIAWLEKNSYINLKLSAFSGAIAQAYMDYLILERNYGGKSHNNQLGILKGFFNLMKGKNRNWIMANPFDGIPELPEDVGKNLAYTVKEREQLKNYFLQHNIRMYYAANFTFHCYIRKTELCELQVSQIDWENRTIRIDSDEAKNRIQDSVTISEDLLAIMYEMGLDKAPGHFYIFGKGMQTCSDKCTRPDDISDLHLKLKKELIAKLGDDTSLRVDDGKAYYSWKHTGVVAYWTVVKDVYFMMRQLRHHDMKVTMVYLKSLGLMPNEAFRNAKVNL